METLPATVLSRLTSAYESRRDPARGQQMSASMRDQSWSPVGRRPVVRGSRRSRRCAQFPFLGLPKPVREALDRDVTAGLPAPTEHDLVELSLACWDRAEREYQYVAVAWLRRHVGQCSPATLPHVRTLIITKSWWDTVDELATRVVGFLVRAHPSLAGVMDTWIDAEDIWLARTAILHQERWKDATDRDRLFAYCLRRAEDREFFLRKAIGWALRTYARVDPEAVRSFVRANEDRLSGLSKREALRRIRP